MHSRRPEASLGGLLAANRGTRSFPLQKLCFCTKTLNTLYVFFCFCFCDEGGLHTIDVNATQDQKDKALQVAMPLRGQTKPQARELNERTRENISKLNDKDTQRQPSLHFWMASCHLGCTFPGAARVPVRPAKRVHGFSLVETVAAKTDLCS